VHEHVQWFGCSQRTLVVIEQVNDEPSDGFFNPPIEVQPVLSEKVREAQVRAADADAAIADVEAFKVTRRYRVAAALDTLADNIARSTPLRAAKARLTSRTAGWRRP
jgi:hypothetical protein